MYVADMGMCDGAGWSRLIELDYQSLSQTVDDLKT